LRRRAPTLAEISGPGKAVLNGHGVSNLRRAGRLAQGLDVGLDSRHRIDESAHSPDPSLAAIRRLVDARAAGGCDRLISGADQKGLTGIAEHHPRFRTDVSYTSTFDPRDELRMDERRINEHQANTHVAQR